MAWVDTIQQRSGNAAGAKLDKKSNSSTKTATLVYTVSFDESTSDETDARQANGVPRTGSRHPRDANLVATSIESSRKGTSNLFVVTVQYESDSLSNDSKGSSPLDKPPRISWGDQVTNEPIDVDASGEPIVNTAGVGFDPPLTEAFHDLTLTITRTEKSYNPVIADSYFNTKNADTFFGFKPGFVRCDGISASNVYVQGVEFWDVTYKFRMRTNWKSGWQRRVRNQGLSERYKDSDGKIKLRAIIDPQTGQPFTEPQPLTASGQWIYRAVAPLNVLKYHIKKVEEWTKEVEKGWLLFDTLKSKKYSPLRLP